MKKYQLDMLYKLKQKAKYLYLLASAFLLTGCGLVDTRSDLYRNVREHTEQFSQNKDSIEVQGTAAITNAILKASSGAKMATYIICPLSWFITWLVLHIVTEDQAVQKKTILTFGIFIPALSIVAAFLIPELVEIFF